MVLKATATLCVVAMLGLAGCDEFAFSDPPTSDQAAYAALQAETLSLRDATESLAVTPVAEIPLMGSAEYRGTAVVALDPLAGGAASELIGTARVTADFAASTVTGQADGFYGTINGGDVTGFDGQVFLSQGAIDRTGTAAQIGADVNGTLQGGGDTLVIDGAVAGNFLGDPLLLNEAPEALSLATDDATVLRLNGAAATGGMEVIATN
jgi:hypothetical protein